MIKKNEDLVFAAVAIVVITLLMLVATTAYAKPQPPAKTQEQIQSAKAESFSQSAAISESAAQSVSDAASSANATNEGNTLVSEGDTVTVEGDSFDFPSNSAFAPPAFTNIDCGELIGFAGTNERGSFSLGAPIPRWLSKKIKDCEKIRDALWLDSIGARQEAIKSRCKIRSMVDNYGSADECYKIVAKEASINNTVESLRERLKASEEYVIFLKEHEKVCEDSLVRCEEKAYGGK